MIRDTIAKRLKQYREAAGFTIYEVGEKVGKSGKTVSAWECGRGQPDADMLLTLCNLYGINNIGVFYSDEESDSLFTLTPDEHRLIHAYRAADTRAREDALHTLLSHPKKQDQANLA